MSSHGQRRAPLTNGMPVLGLGTWQNDDPDECAQSVATALDAGYRHVDTAQAYRNDEGVGRGIAAADVPREDVFLATKVWTSKLGYADVLASTEESLERLGVDSVDLLYVHWPAGDYDPEETFRAFDELVDDGKVDRIGISNFLPEQVDEAIDAADTPIFANQVEMHPLLQQDALREHCAERDVELVAYSPLARGKVFDVPELTEIAEKHDVSEAQVSLAWLRQKGVTAIPKATSESHILDNWRSLDVDLDDGDIDAIDAIDRTEREVDPDYAPW
ncbi:aldo/keto reductase [Halobellus captivus]|uniref:aldo/keto reductase n=1 Tax=Halobellus captivus TaxID=2592614 RepID=UPI001EEFEDEE|nr:aldo/keto reductase [Halobellus captivus]